MSEFIPGYSDEPRYWTNATKNEYIRRYNVGFLRHKLSQVCRSRFSCYKYYDGIVVRITDLKDKSPVEELLRHYTGRDYMLWRDVSGRTIDGLEIDMFVELYKFIDAEEDGYLLRPLLSDGVIE